MNLALKLIRIKFKILSILNPSLAAKQVLEIFQRPHFKKLRDREKEFFQIAKEKRIEHEGEDIILYELGDPAGQPVLMVHGWDSNPGSMYGIARELVKHGFFVLSLNVPAHGISKVKKTNMLKVSELITEVLKKYPTSKTFSFVTHSFGSGAVTFALSKSGIKADKLVFVTSPDKLKEVFRDFARLMGLNDKAFEYMLKITEKRFDKTFDEMQISKLLQKTDFNKLLIVHDRQDKILPFHNAKRIHELNPNSELFATEGKGHYRILWDEEVINKIKDFFNKNKQDSV